MNFIRAVLSFGLMATLTPSVSVRAQQTPPDTTAAEDALQAADDALKSGDPDLALKHLADLRGPLSHEAVVEHRRLLGTARAFVDDTDGAIAAFSELVRYAPSFSFPYTASPKVTFAFESARASERKKRPLTVTVTAPPVARLDEPINITVARQGDSERRLRRARLRSTDSVTGTAAHYDAAFVDDVATFVLPGQTRENAILDDDGLPGVVVVMVADGLDADGSALVESAAVTLPVGFDAPPPWWQSPVLVGVGATVGIIVAGALTAGILIANQPPDVVDGELEVRR
jgi:hypothetical protein